MTGSSLRPESWSDSRPVAGPELRRISFSNTVTYRLQPDEFAERAAGLAKRFAGSGEIADFVAIRGSVVEMMSTAQVPRYAVPLRLAPNQSAPNGVDDFTRLFARISEMSSFLAMDGDYSAISLTINFVLPSASVDELIALSHSCYGSSASSAVLISLDSTTTSGHSLKELHEHLAKQLGISSSAQISDQFRCIEIREIESFADADAALSANIRPMYGALLGDEGWRHVPETVASSTLAKRWGTRSFFTVVSSGDGCLMLNLRPQAYSISQEKFFGGFFDGELSYFSHEFKVACVDHGPFFAMELCSYRKCVADDLRRRLERRGSSPSPPSVLGGIRHRAYRRSLYNELTQGLRRLRLNRMTELAALDNVVEAGSGLPDRLARLNELVQAFEAEEQVAYMYRVNSTMATIAWITLAVAVFGAVLTVIALVAAL